MADSLARFKRASAGYGERLVFTDLDLILPKGRIIALCGPNGSGKSTALRVMRRLMPVSAGGVEIAGRDARDWSARALAQQVAMLAQSPEAPEEMRVRDLVMLGRYAHRRAFAGPAETDRAATDRALSAANMTHHADVPIGQLSGGQLQRAWIAMVLAQEAGIILLDEPTNHLDIAHALEVLELLRELNRQQGRSIVVVLHDLNLAARYADHVVLFDRGRVIAEGPVAEVMRADLLSDTFGIECQVIDDPRFGHPMVVPYPRRVNAAQAAE